MTCHVQGEAIAKYVEGTLAPVSRLSSCVDPQAIQEVMLQMFLSSPCGRLCSNQLIWTVGAWDRIDHKTYNQAQFMIEAGVRLSAAQISTEGSSTAVVGHLQQSQ